MSTSGAPLKISCRNCRTHLDISDLDPFTSVPCPVCGTMLRIPGRFDRYLLEKRCGSGSCTTVYRAIDPRLSRRVAVKVLENSGEDSEKLGERFFAEARLVAKLNHPAILPVYNCGVFEGRPFLVLRYMDMGDLGTKRKRHELPAVPRLLEVTAAVAEALYYAWRTANVVHHDVKPSNILLSSTGEIRLGDFDLADVRRPGDTATPCPEWGSPAYASPERLYSGGEDFRGDIFSLGAPLYELLGGVTPFGVSGEPEELYERRRDMAFPALCTLAPEVSTTLSDLVTRMLGFSPERRPGYPEIIRELRRERSALC